MVIIIVIISIIIIAIVLIVNLPTTRQIFAMTVSFVCLFVCLILYDKVSHPARLTSAMSLCLGDPALQPLRTATQRFVNLMMTRRMLMMMTMKRIDNGGDDDHDHV